METFRNDGLTFEVLDGGPVDGPPVVLLHGFPQDAGCWTDVRDHLHRAGLRTLAPQQRGYSPLARPRAAGAYTSQRLVADVLALLDAAGLEQATIVGHDWGAGVAWALAQEHADRVAALVVLSVPHPAALSWAMRHSDQARRSWYMLAFQLPWLPERALARLIRTDGLARQGVPPEHNRRYRGRFASAASLRGPINWYRALLRRGGRNLGAGAVRVPTTFIWGSLDPFIGRASALRTAQHVTGDYRFVEVDAGHWLPEREPELVAAEIVARAGAGARSRAKARDAYSADLVGMRRAPYPDRRPKTAG